MQHADRSAMLGTMKMNRLVPKVSVPIMISMIVQALYNVVDSMYVAQYNPSGLTAVSLAAPFQMLMIALSTGMGTGINSLVSRRLGEQRSGEARRASWNGLLIECAGSFLFILVGLLLAGPIMNLVAGETLKNRDAIIRMGTEYLSIVTMWSTGLFVAIFFERMLQSTGNTMASMITQLCGAVTNIILDPILIFGKLGLQPMGVSGAAIATVIGQWVSAVVGFILNQIKNEELKLNPKDFLINSRDFRDIVAVGLPSTIMASIGSVMNVGMNAILQGFAESNAGLNVLAVYFKLQSLIFMPVFGLANGIIAIIGYNFGARMKSRIYQCIRVALIWAGTIMVVGTLVFMIFPSQLMSIFESGDTQAAQTETVAEQPGQTTASAEKVTAQAEQPAAAPDDAAEEQKKREEQALVTEQMTRIGVIAMRIICLNFIFAAIGITLSTVFQAIGKGTYSMVLSICRQLVILLPVAWLLSVLTHNVYVVWWCFPISEFVSLFICLYMFRKCNREMLAPLPD